MSPMTQRPFQMEYVLLGYLSHSPQHGYSLYQQLSARMGVGRIWRLKPSQLYALLEKLEVAGLVTSQLQPQDPHPPRKIFSLTSSGQRAYQSWRVSPVERPHQIRQLFLVRLFFCLQDNPPDALILVDGQRQAALKWLAGLEKPAPGEMPVPFFDQAVQRYRTEQVKMILSWLDECRSELEKEARSA